MSINSTSNMHVPCVHFSDYRLYRLRYSTQSSPIAIAKREFGTPKKEKKGVYFAQQVLGISFFSQQVFGFVVNWVRVPLNSL